MTLLWPGFLLLLGLAPLMLAAYLWALRRRKPVALRYSSLSLIRAAAPQQSRLRRHLPMALFLLAVTSLVLALGRPAAAVRVPGDQTTVMLTIDVSRSMLQTDVSPNRLAAAQAAALEFIERQASNTQIGVVAFAGSAYLIQPPTRDKQALRTAIESLTTARRTAIGYGILESLDTLADFDETIAPTSSDLETPAEAPPGQEGSYAPHIIVVLTDGVNSSGPTPVEAAQQAANRRVRVHTIGFGTVGSAPPPDTDPLGDLDRWGGGNRWGTFSRDLDEETLKEVAAMTGGEYFAATSAAELETVFRDLATTVMTKVEWMEISVFFAAIGALLAALALLLALIWHPLP